MRVMQKWKRELKVGDKVYFTHGQGSRNVFNGYVSKSPVYTNGRVFISLSAMPRGSKGNPWYLYIRKAEDEYHKDQVQLMVRVRVPNLGWYDIPEESLFRTHKEAVKDALHWHQMKMKEQSSKESQIRMSFREIEARKKFLEGEIERLRNALKAEVKTKKSRTKK